MGLEDANLGMGQLWQQPKWFASLGSNVQYEGKRLGKMGIIHVKAFNFYMSSYFKYLCSPLGVICVTVFSRLWQCEEGPICASVSQTKLFKVSFNVNKNYSYGFIGIIMHNLEINKNIVNKILICLPICRSGPRVSKFLFCRKKLLPQMKI